jgi:deoxycytidine triphosphate deaminase
MILGGHDIVRSFTPYLSDDRWKMFKWDVEEDEEYQVSNDEIAEVVGPNSFDLTLAPWAIRPSADDTGTPSYPVERIDDGICLLPEQTLLACTAERVVQPEGSPWVPMLEGKSTLARMFILVHVTAGFGDAGFQNYWTLEIKNIGSTPWVLHPGMRIAQLYWIKCERPLRYRGNYDRKMRVNPQPIPVPPNFDSLHLPKGKSVLLEDWKVS